MAIPRELETEEYRLFRETARRFVAEEIAPYHAQWEREGIVSRDVWLRAGAERLLLTAIPEDHGGAGGDFLHSAIFIEEMMRGGYSGPGFRLHSDIMAPYLLHYGTEAQKQQWLPRMARGEVIGAIAMTEPGAGSDLQAITTQARREDGEFVLNGAKTFITNGQLADLAIVACKTDRAAGTKGISLLLVEGDRPRFRRGRNLEKLGLKAQDTSELFFDDVRLPASNLLGEEGRGFRYLMTELPQERLLVAISSIAMMEGALEETLTYTRERKAFGQAIADFQANRFALAEMTTELAVARVFIDRCIELHMRGALDVETAAMCKFWVSERACSLIDHCLQMHGGYGYMWEYRIARLYADVRVQRIFAGTNEIMRELVARAM
jgi:alkylation response protein AidB-like acyl-CoA dehydrogenase